MKTVLVYFLGGCTFSEVAALRFIAQKQSKSQVLVRRSNNIIIAWNKVYDIYCSLPLIDFLLCLSALTNSAFCQRE